MQDCNQLDIMSVATTVASLADAKALAAEILAQRLAACVQLDKEVLSLYHWKGELRQEPEVRLTIKTLPGCAAALQALFAQKHPYELPQFVAVQMSASESYVQWVTGAVSGAANP